MPKTKSTNEDGGLYISVRFSFVLNFLAQLVNFLREACIGTVWLSN